MIDNLQWGVAQEARVRSAGNNYDDLALIDRRS
jgi:hypothetical protein